MHTMTEVTIPMTNIDALKHRQITGMEFCLWVFLKSLEEKEGEGVEMGLEEPGRTVRDEPGASDDQTERA
jgi:hypothetical protein